MPNSPSQIVACFVELSSNKERSTLEHSVVKTLSQLFNCELYLLQLHNGRGEYDPEIRFWKPNPDNKSQTKPNLQGDEFQKTLASYLKKLDTQTPAQLYLQKKQVFWPLYVGENCLDVIVLERTVLINEELTLLAAVGSIFANFMELLDAGERDALTGLYNRRVFDTRLNALVSKSMSITQDTGERRGNHKQVFNFLGIIDIDFFKRVNDDFGHLFGDEVLLWLAQQMRHCFRNEDALFRYGGEEFAVLLAGLNEQQAQDTFERFRNAIATTAFPQIGQITVSIGYASIDSQANPTLVFGEADQALYYAKNHGRNRVDCFGRLMQSGSIENDREKVDIELF